MPHTLHLNSDIAPQAKDPRWIAIVVSEYNQNITGKLKDGAVRTLHAAGVRDEDILIIPVPGAWELSFGVQQAILNKNCRGAIALGAVIRGETTHDVHINRAVSNSLMQLSLDHQKPVAFGLLTVNNLEQAIQRSGGNVGNKGEEAASALVASLQVASALQRFTLGE